MNLQDNYSEYKKAYYWTGQEIEIIDSGQHLNLDRLIQNRLQAILFGQHLNLDHLIQSRLQATLYVACSRVSVCGDKGKRKNKSARTRGIRGNR